MRFLHAADIHLGTTFRSRPEVGRRLQDALRLSFEDLATVAVERQVDFVLIAGDLFEASRAENLSLTVRAAVAGVFKRLDEAGIPTFVAPGNHDPMTPAGVYREMTWPEGVTIFDSAGPRSVAIETTSPKATIHSVAHTSAATTTNLVERIRGDDDGRFHIGLVHCNVQDYAGSSQDENYAPCQRSDLVGRGIHYWALGHIHAPGVVIESEHPPMVAAYCGCLCGLGYGDLGPRGCTLVTVDEDLTIHREFAPIGRIRWELLERELGPEDDVDAVQTAVRRHVESLGLGDRLCCLRVRLTGRTRLFGRHDDEEWREHAEVLRDELGLLDLEFDRQLRPVVSMDDYADQPHILGELIRTYREMTAAGEGVEASALADVLGEESLRFPEADPRKMDAEEVGRYRRRVLDRAMDVLVDAFVRESS
ncbi:MAG: DNA repair exonuclease [Phycisphaerae bacterium]|nr:DNA repair exonuclease [Phycisphaerae bacterium]